MLMESAGFRWAMQQIRWGTGQAVGWMSLMQGHTQDTHSPVSLVASLGRPRPG